MNAAVDTEKQEKDLAGLKKTRRETDARIEKISEQMDKLDATDAMYDRKYADLEKRQNAQYDKLARLEDEIGILDAKVRKVFRANTNYKQAMVEVAEKSIVGACCRSRRRKNCSRSTSRALRFLKTQNRARE